VNATAWRQAGRSDHFCRVIRFVVNAFIARNCVNRRIKRRSLKAASGSRSNTIGTFRPRPVPSRAPVQGRAAASLSCGQHARVDRLPCVGVDRLCGNCQAARSGRLGAEGQRTRRAAVTDPGRDFHPFLDEQLVDEASAREPLARVRALLRRSRGCESVADGFARVRAYRFAGWALNVRLRRLKSPQGNIFSATNSEFSLLVALLAAPQRVLSRVQLLELSRLHP